MKDQELFNYLNQEFDILPLASDIDEIQRICNKQLEAELEKVKKQKDYFTAQYRRKSKRLREKNQKNNELKAELEKVKFELHLERDLKDKIQRLEQFKESVRDIATTFGDGSVSERMIQIKQLLSKDNE